MTSTNTLGRDSQGRELAKGQTVRIGNGRTDWTVGGFVDRDGFLHLTATAARGHGIQNRYEAPDRLTIQD